MERRLKALTLLFYGMPALPLSMLTMPLVLYIPPFYAAEVGLSLTLVGAVFFLARAWDGVTDPLIGLLSDRSRTRWGRRKPWILAGTPLLMIATWFLCQPPEGAGFAYLLFWVFFFYATWTMVQIPHLSWGAELSDDYRERSRIVGFREGSFLVGVLCATGLPILVLGAAEPSLREILRVFAISVVIILPVSVILCLLMVPHQQGVRQSLSITEMVGVLRRNRLFLRILAVTFLVWLGIHVYNATVLLVLQHVLGFPGSVFLKLVFLQFVIGTLFTPFIVRIANRIGKHVALALGIFGTALALPAMSMVTPGATWQIMTVFAIFGLVISPIWVLPTALVADVVDYGALRGGGRQEGLYMALYTIAVKAALAVSVGVALPLLDILGFDPAGSNGEGALLALKAVGLWLPALILLPAGLLLWRYPLDAARHHTIVRRLARRPAAGV